MNDFLKYSTASNSIIGYGDARDGTSPSKMFVVIINHFGTLECNLILNETAKIK